MTMTNDSYAGYCACICRNSFRVYKKIHDENKEEKKTGELREAKKQIVNG